MVNPISWLINKRKQHQKAHETKKQKALDEQHIDRIVQVLEDVVLLSSLSKQSLKLLAGMFRSRTYSLGEHVMDQGETGDEFYIIKDGSVDVILTDSDGNESKVVSLKDHEYFGEQALLNDSERMATIRVATEHLEVLVLNRQQFEELKESGDVLFPHRRAVCADDMKVLSTPEVVDNLDTKTKGFIKECIKTNLLFNNHSEAVIDDVLDYFKLEQFSKGDVVIKEGEANGTTFYVISDGEVSVETEKSGQVCLLDAGTCFGELALMYNAPRNATIRVVSDTAVMYTMERQAFRYQVIQHQKKNDEHHFEFLRGVKLLNPLLSHEITLLDMAMKKIDFKPSEVIFSQGDVADTFYIVRNGTCDGLKQMGKQEESFVVTAGNFFGEVAVMKGQPRGATVSAGSEGCTVLALSSEDFHQLLGPLQSIMERNAEEYEKPVSQRSLIGDNSKICELEELQTVGLLGRGAFGKVTLVLDPYTKKSYALKAIKKTQIEELGQASHIVNEKKVMMMMNCRFLVNLRRTYKDAWRVYFLVDVCLGGELFTILRKKRSFNEKYTQFYAGCVVEAFSYMHSLDIIYRDLKPENLVMDRTGYIKVTDFGFAKVVPKKTYTLCGTPDYLAPEIVTGQGHGKGVDWWCLGVLIYELLSSFPPFFDEEPMGTYRKIIQGKFKFPKYFSTEARDLIARLLRTKPTKRLAVMKGGADNIRKHFWYKGFNWNELREGEMAAPFVPEVKSVSDISNFDQRDKKKSIQMTGKPPKTPWDVEF